MAPLAQKVPNPCTRQTQLLVTTWVLEAALSSFLLLHLDTFCSTVAFL